MYQYGAGLATPEVEQDIFYHREELADLIQETYLEVEQVRLMSNGGDRKVVFELTVEAGRILRNLDGLVYDFLRVKEAEREVAKAQKDLDRLKARGV
jgi:hypothetical protein